MVARATDAPLLDPKPKRLGGLEVRGDGVLEFLRGVDRWLYFQGHPSCSLVGIPDRTMCWYRDGRPSLGGPVHLAPSV